MTRASRLCTTSALLASAADIGEMLFAPPGVPEARRNALRRAFDAMMRDPEFIADAAKRQVEGEYLAGAELTKIVEESARMPAEIVARVKDVTRPM